jgi:hypothetical protein
MIPEAPTNERCTKFSDYLLETYVDENSKYPPTMMKPTTFNFDFPEFLSYVRYTAFSFEGNKANSKGT